MLRLYVSCGQNNQLDSRFAQPTDESVVPSGDCTYIVLRKNIRKISSVSRSFVL